MPSSVHIHFDGLDAVNATLMAEIIDLTGDADLAPDAEVAPDPGTQTLLVINLCSSSDEADSEQERPGPSKRRRLEVGVIAPHQTFVFLSSKNSFIPF